MKDIDICLKFVKMEVDIPSRHGGSPFYIIYASGKARIVELPIRETKLVIHQGKVKRVKFDEGEEF